MAWAGLGLNLNIPGPSWAEYTNTAGTPILNELQDYGVTRFRVTPVSFGSANSRDTMRLYCSQLRESFPDAYIIFGTTCSGGTTKITSSNWEAYADQVVEDAAYAEANGLCDEFVIGNEMENSANNDGTLSAQEIRDYMKLLAIDVAEVYSGIISYNVAQGQEDGWITDGRGTLRLGFNIYGESNGDWTSFKNLVIEVFTEFGEDCYLSEWSGSASDWTSTTLGAISETAVGFDDAYAQECKRRMDFLEALGIPSAYVFTHVWFEPTARNTFAIRQWEGGERAVIDWLLERRIRNKFWGN